MWSTIGITKETLPHDGFRVRTLTHPWMWIPVAAIFCLAATTLRADDIVGVKVPLVTFKGKAFAGRPKMVFV